MNDILIAVLVIIIIFIISALPLHLAVKILGGKTNIIKSFLVTLITGIITAIIAVLLPFGELIALIVLIWIYHEIFRLKWFKSFIAWILQIIFVFLLGLIATIFGIGVFTFSLIT